MFAARVLSVHRSIADYAGTIGLQAVAAISMDEDSLVLRLKVVELRGP